MHITVLMVVMVVLGGAGTVVGRWWARCSSPTSRVAARAANPRHAFVLGADVLAVSLLPQGFTTYLTDARKTRRFSLLDNVRRYRL